MTSAKKGTQNSPKSTTATTKRRAAFADDERVATRARLKSDERETQPPRDDQPLVVSSRCLDCTRNESGPLSQCAVWTRTVP